MNYQNYKLNVLKDERSSNLIFQPDGRNHYVYRITDLNKNKHYYGSRVTKLKPNADLGVKYFSSSSIKEFIIEQQEFKNNFKYKVVRSFDNQADKIIFESFLHEKFKVSSNKTFYNRMAQMEFGPSNLGVKASNNTKKLISLATSGANNPRYGKKVTEETRKKMSLARVGKIKSKETRDKISKANKNRFKGSKSYAAKSCIVHNQTFGSAKEAFIYFKNSKLNNFKYGYYIFEIYKRSNKN